MAALPCGICNEKATKVEEKCLNYFEDPNKKLLASSRSGCRFSGCICARTFPVNSPGKCETVGDQFQGCDHWKTNHDPDPLPQQGMRLGFLFEY